MQFTAYFCLFPDEKNTTLEMSKARNNPKRKENNQTAL